MNPFKSVGRWVEDRTGLAATLKPLLKHPVPPNTGWAYVFGSATLTLFIVQVITGVALATAYVPSTESAYTSLQYITHTAALGSMLRGMHYWGASLMVIFVGLHMIRVFLTGAFKFPREMNWLTGVVLLGLTLAMGFSGQLLRWDQNAVWSVVVGAEQAGRTPWIGGAIARFIIGGNTVGAATLSRFFAVHVFLVPGLIFAFIGAHLFLVIRNGISEPPQRGRPVDPKTYRAWYNDMLKRVGRPFWPDAAWRDAVVVLGLIVMLLLLAILRGPPELGKPPDPSIIEAHPRPDWYLLWYFAILALLPHGTESYFIILAPLVIGVSLFLVPLIANRGERSPARRPWAVGSVLVIVTLIGVLTLAGEREPWSPQYNTQPLSAQQIGADSGPVYAGALLFNTKGCQACHAIAGQGGVRGPDLSNVGARLNEQELTWRILNGGYNMPAYGSILTPDELHKLVVFLQSRSADAGE